MKILFYQKRSCRIILIKINGIIANKQDLPETLKPEQIEQILGLKTYSIVAVNPENKKK